MSMYGMTNSRKIFWWYHQLADRWSRIQTFTVSNFRILQLCTRCIQVSFLSYVYDCVYWYTSKELVKWFLDKLVRMFHVKFLGYAHWFISIRISQLKDYIIPVDQSRYTTSVLTKYLDTDTIKWGSKVHKATLPHDMICTKEDASTSD